MSQHHPIADPLREPEGSQARNPNVEHLREGKPACAAMKALFRIMDAWGVANDQARILLGSPSRSTFFRWKAGEIARLPHDTLMRISYVLGIYKTLQTIYSTDRRYADEWIKRPNTAFGGQSALEHMLGGQITDLADVRVYLDANREGWS
jgi:hypothetical protein